MKGMRASIGKLLAHWGRKCTDKGVFPAVMIATDPSRSFPGAFVFAVDDWTQEDVISALEQLVKAFREGEIVEIKKLPEPSDN